MLVLYIVCKKKKQKLRSKNKIAKKKNKTWRTCEAWGAPNFQQLPHVTSCMPHVFCQLNCLSPKIGTTGIHSLIAIDAWNSDIQVFCNHRIISYFDLKCS